MTELDAATARDSLVERMARRRAEINSGPWDEIPQVIKDSWRARSSEDLAVIESAAAECETCWGHRASDLTPPAICKSCRGEPGPLLILQVLGGSPATYTLTNMKGELNDPELWRFPRRENTNSDLWPNEKKMSVAEESFDGWEQS